MVLGKNAPHPTVYHQGVSLEIFLFLLKWGIPQGGSYSFVEGRSLCCGLSQPAPADPHQPTERGWRDSALRLSSTSAAWLGPQ